MGLNKIVCVLMALLSITCFGAGRSPAVDPGNFVDVSTYPTPKNPNAGFYNFVDKSNLPQKLSPDEKILLNKMYKEAKSGKQFSTSGPWLSYSLLTLIFLLPLVARFGLYLGFKQPSQAPQADRRSQRENVVPLRERRKTAAKTAKESIDHENDDDSDNKKKAA